MDVIFSFNKAYYILDEFLLNGEILESSRVAVLKSMSEQDNLEDEVCVTAIIS